MRKHHWRKHSNILANKGPIQECSTVFNESASSCSRKCIQQHRRADFVLRDSADRVTGQRRRKIPFEPTRSFGGWETTHFCTIKLVQWQIYSRTHALLKGRMCKAPSVFNVRLLLSTDMQKRCRSIWKVKKKPCKRRNKKPRRKNDQQNVSKNRA